MLAVVLSSASILLSNGIAITERARSEGSKRSGLRLAARGGEGIRRIPGRSHFARSAPRCSQAAATAATTASSHHGSAWPRKKIAGIAPLDLARCTALTGAARPSLPRGEKLPAAARLGRARSGRFFQFLFLRLDDLLGR